MGYDSHRHCRKRLRYVLPEVNPMRKTVLFKVKAWFWRSGAKNKVVEGVDQQRRELSIWWRSGEDEEGSVYSN